MVGRQIENADGASLAWQPQAAEGARVDYSRPPDPLVAPSMRMAMEYIVKLLRLN
jgi:hypothetical protein